MMKKGFLNQLPEEVCEMIVQNTIESYEFRDVIIELLHKNPMFIIRKYLDSLTDYLEQKDMEFIKNNLKIFINYEWFYYKFKKRIKENMDLFVKDVAQSFVRVIETENRYEYDAHSGKLIDCGKFDMNKYKELGDFLCDYELSIDKSEDDIDVDNSSTFLDNIAIAYLHDTLRKLLKDVYDKKKEDFLKFFSLESEEELNERDFEELEYQLFETFNNEFPLVEINNPVVSTKDLVAQASRLDLKMLYELGVK